MAMSGCQLVGSAALVQNGMGTKLDLSSWLAAVYVKDGFRHLGIATKLIARCEEKVVRSGANA
ncbi:GNAT family N-acetyltransferase [Vreelandella songnenensis]|uniref:GNAT family N-acetyltransferase n=1 Tax=Vreelandella songnenensis TaxID=1176243 RepID=UPI003BF5CD58